MGVDVALVAGFCAGCEACSRFGLGLYAALAKDCIIPPLRALIPLALGLSPEGVGLPCELDGDSDALFLNWELTEGLVGIGFWGGG